MTVKLFYNVFARFFQNSVDRDVMRGTHGILGRECYFMSHDRPTARMLYFKWRCAQSEMSVFNKYYKSNCPYILKIYVLYINIAIAKNGYNIVQFLYCMVVHVSHFCTCKNALRNKKKFFTLDNNKGSSKWNIMTVWIKVYLDLWLSNQYLIKFLFSTWPVYVRNLKMTC